MTNGVTLGRLLALADVSPAVDARDARLDVAVAGIAYDSRVVQHGDVFVAIAGRQHDGTAFASEACDRGAVAIVAEAPAPPEMATLWVSVTDARAALPALAAALHRHPSHELLVVGTTGTNGKTTTTYLIEGVLTEAGMSCGRVSTVANRIGETERVSERTTPEAPELQAMLRQMVDRGDKACAMEVSSHALAFKRVAGIRFGAAVFTNLTRDHLDFHGDMNAYFATKRQLFDELPETAPAVINVDDPYGRTLADEVPRAVTYAVDADADVRPERLDLSLDGIDLDLQLNGERTRIRSRLLGRTNTFNVLAAAATGVALSLPASAIAGGIASVDAVPGRMQVVSGAEDDLTVIVDYAHTDDALRGLLEAARPLARGRVVTVFGCGGDRDATKRPLMGAVAARMSDFVMVTSDNPRSEDPEQIAHEIESGLAGGGRSQASRPADVSVSAEGTPWVTVLDRAEAIARAIRDARPGDLVIIAGKGHERYQQIGARLVPFDDAAVARAALDARRSGMPVG